MRESWRRRAEIIWNSGRTFVLWGVLAVLIGAVVGLVGALFSHAIHAATALRAAHDWLIWLLPLGGAAIVLLYRVCGLGKDPGTNYVLVAVRDNAPMRLRMAPLIILSTALTHLLGGSSGREGAAIQLGGSIAGKAGAWLKLDEKDERVLTMCGMAAGFSALFGTPIAGAMFSMEVCSVGVMYYAAIFPSALSALTARLVAVALGVEAEAFTLAGVPALEAGVLPAVAAVGLVCALVAMAMVWTLGKVHHLFDKVPSPVLRAVLGGAIVAGLTFALGTRDYNGAGTDVIARAVAGEARPEAFALKILLTAITLGCGFKGGEIVPALFAGATSGCCFAPLVGLSPSFGAGLGMAGVFCAVTNCPLTALLLAYELFGGAGLPLFALCCAVSYMMSGYHGLYSEQKIMYSKFKAEYVNRRSGD